MPIAIVELIKPLSLIELHLFGNTYTEAHTITGVLACNKIKVMVESPAPDTTNPEK